MSFAHVCLCLCVCDLMGMHVQREKGDLQRKENSSTISQGEAGRPSNSAHCLSVYYLTIYLKVLDLLL